VTADADDRADARPPRFRAAIFDMDGLLIDSERAITEAWLAGAKALGFTLEREDFVQVIGLAGPESDAYLTRLLGGERPFLAIAAHARAALEAADRDAPTFPLKPGAAALLAALARAGVPLAVASSSRVEEIHRRLGRVGVLGHFRAIAGGDEVPRGKPDPAVYLLAAQRLGVAPADCIAFEDSENGARAAQAAGVRVVVVPDLKRPADEVLARAHGVIDSLQDALAHVPHWFPRL
jgi:HAD superfamily hydrolase (TIGR01509 family)